MCVCIYIYIYICIYIYIYIYNIGKRRHESPRGGTCASGGVSDDSSWPSKRRQNRQTRIRYSLRGSESESEHMLLDPITHDVSLVEHVFRRRIVYRARTKVVLVKVVSWIIDCFPEWYSIYIHIPSISLHTYKSVYEINGYSGNHLY